jgi:hypothetical protein
MNRKKNLTEILDIGKAYANRREENYLRIIEDNNSYFKKNLGIFTNIIDAAQRNGNIIQPFDINKNANIHNIPKRDSNSYKLNRLKQNLLNSKKF